MRYTFWDVVVLYCAALSAVFAFLEISTFLLMWILIARAPHYMVLIPFLTRSYISFQPYNNWGLVVALLCIFLSILRLLFARLNTGKAEEDGDVISSVLKRRRTLLMVSVLAALLGVLRLLAWAHWPFIYW